MFNHLCLITRMLSHIVHLKSDYSVLTYISVWSNHNKYVNSLIKKKIKICELALICIEEFLICYFPFPWYSLKSLRTFRQFWAQIYDASLLSKDLNIQLQVIQSSIQMNTATIDSINVRFVIPDSSSILITLQFYALIIL